MVDVLVGQEHLVVLDDLVQLEAQRRRDQGDHRPPGQGRAPGRQQQGLGLVGLPEPHDLEHGEGVVPGGVVDDLHHPDGADVLAQPEGPDGDAGVAVAGVDARGEEGRPALLAGGLQLVAEPGLLGVQQGHERRVDHVLARRQHPADVVDHLAGADVGVGRVADAVGVEGEQGVDVLGGGDAHRVDAAQLTGVAAGLVVAVDPEADQLEIGVVDDGGHGVDADGARRPLDDLVAHVGDRSAARTTVDSGDRPQREDD